MKVNLDVVKRGCSTAARYIKPVIAVMTPIVAMTVAEKGTNIIMNKIRYNGKVTYADAVRAILRSGMFSDAKQKAIHSLNKNGDSAYYRSVIDVAESSLFSDDKIEIIKSLDK